VDSNSADDAEPAHAAIKHFQLPPSKISWGQKPRIEYDHWIAIMTSYDLSLYEQIKDTAGCRLSRAVILLWQLHSTGKSVFR